MKINGKERVLHIRRGIFIPLFMLLFSAALSAQEVTIDISWGDFNRNQYDGVLMLPQSGDGTYEFIGGFKKMSSSDGHVSVGTGGGSMITSLNRMHWEISRMQRGVYKLYLFCVAGGSGSYEQWPEDVRVTVSMNGESRVYHPREREGEVWEILYINGGTRDIEERQVFFPFRHMVYGNLRDALTGTYLENVDVRLFDADTGKPISGKQMRTGDNGFYYFYGFPLGRYMIRFEMDGYIPLEMKTDFILMDLPRRLNPVMSPVLASTQFRITLEWGARPTDLDVHLLGPGPAAGEAFHISYSHMHEYGGRHFLDIDDKDGYGPETITIGGLDRGNYTFAIHDFRNRRLTSGSWHLANSGAIVRVYRGSSMIGQFPVPDREGTLWRVFSIDGGTGKVLPMNEMTYVTDPDGVR